jgi:uncharacterized protein (TIGR00251 family)
LTQETRPSCPWILRAADLLALRVRLSPKSAFDRIEGIEPLSDGTYVLKVRVRAPPQDGEANRALLHLLAKSLDVTVSAIHLENGATARVKTLVMSGDAASLAARLGALCARHAPK